MKDQRSYGTSSRLKRKGNEPVFPAKRPPPPPPPPRRPTVTGSTMKKGNEMKKKKTMMTLSEKKVLAGFMAYEFIKRGTVLGHKFDNNELNKGNESSININNNNNNNNSCYKEITSLLLMNNNNNNNNNEDVDEKNKQVEENGVCWIPGVVNPSQLATWISGK